MTPFERRLLTAAKALRDQRLPITVARLASALRKQPANVNSGLASLISLGFMSREKHKHPTNSDYYIYMVAPKPGVTGKTRITICPPGYAEGYGLDNERNSKRGATLNSSDPWC